MNDIATEEIWTGRKGVSYDWRHVLAEIEVGRVDVEWSTLPVLTGADH